LNEKIIYNLQALERFMATSTKLIGPLRDSADRRTTSDGPRTLISALAEKMRADIIACILLPGEKLRLPDLSNRYNCGINPLREALARLSTTGLVEVEDQKGFRVAAVSREDLLDLTRVRQQIECLALTQAIERGDVEWEMRVVSTHHRLTRLSVTTRGSSHQISDIWEAAHLEFHRALISACESRWLLHFSGVLAEQSARYRRMAVGITSSARDIVGEHAALADAAIARDAPRVCAQITAHFAATTETILSLSAASPERKTTSTRSLLKRQHRRS
jgi:GntR family transcriptional regulator, carbon starvation induced regulator